MTTNRYGRYEIVEELGRGSMGVVFKAYDPNIDRIIALKVLRPDRVTSKAFVERFLKEAKAIGRLSHPNIVAVYDVGQDHGTIYIAMEFLEGTPLNDLIAKGDMEIKEIIKIAFQVASALDYAHKKGIVHRDIKPSNIIITPEGDVKLTDFGIAHIDDPSMPHQTQAGEILGTPAYMSPEQVLGRSVEGSADIFSLGIVIYEMVTGVRPFKGPNLAAIFNAITQISPEEPSRLRPDCPQALSKIIMKCLEKEPDRRFQTAGELASALQKLLTPPGRESEKPSKKGLLAGLLAVVVVAVAGIVIYLNQTKEAPPKPTAVIEATSRPPGARVFVDGKFQGWTPSTLEIPIGKHEIRFSKDGFYDWEAQIVLKEGQTTPLSITLMPKEEEETGPDRAGPEAAKALSHGH